MERPWAPGGRGLGRGFERGFAQQVNPEGTGRGVQGGWLDFPAAPTGGGKAGGQVPARVLRAA